MYIRIKINHFQYAISNHIANKRENKKKLHFNFRREIYFFLLDIGNIISLNKFLTASQDLSFHEQSEPHTPVFYELSPFDLALKRKISATEREREREGTVVSKQPVRKACGRSVTRWLTARIPSSSLYDDGSMDRCNCRQRVPEMCSPCMTRITDKGHASTTAFVREFTNR